MSVLAEAAGAALTVALLSLATSAGAYAQSPPSKAGAGTPPSAWRFGVDADATWYENAQFVGGAEGATTWSTRGTASLGYSRRFSSGTFGMGAYGGALYYPELEDFNQPVWGGNLSLNVASSTRTQFRLGQTYSRTNTRQLAFDPAAPPLPTSVADYASTTAGLTQRLSRSWQLELGGSFDLRHYEDSRLVDGEQVTASGQLGRRFGKYSAFYAGYEFENAWLASTTNRAHQALVGVRRKPERGVGIEAAAGVAYLETVGQLYPAGNASLQAQGRHASFTLTYRRDFGQAFGYGRQMIGDLGAASLGWTPATGLTLSANYSYGYRRDPAETDYTVRSQTASGGFDWGVTKELGLSARYSWERNETEGLRTIEGSRVMASVSYGVEWR